MADTEIPEKFAGFLEPKRYKVAYGGRGGAKSRTIAALLLELGFQKPLRVLCCREVQRSIKDSVHRLLSDQIKRAGLTAYYQILETEIRGTNGTVFMFRGLKGETMDSIKSVEGVDICWIEEAQSISQRSIDILIPTIRKDGSEFWFSMNPELETDPIYRDYIANERDDTLRVQVGIEDNPWAPPVLLLERDRAYREDPEKAAWVWGGACRPVVEGAIYAREVLALNQAGRVCHIAYEEASDTFVSFDLGIGDHTSVIVGQRIGQERRIIHAYENFSVPLSHYITHLKDLPYRIDNIILPHDGANRSLLTGKSPEDMLKGAFPQASVTVMDRLPVEHGINNAREHFAAVWIDKGCAILLEALKKYKRRKNNETGMFEDPLHDTFSDMADSFRYWMLAEPPRKKHSAPVKQRFAKAW